MISALAADAETKRPAWPANPHFSVNSRLDSGLDSRFDSQAPVFRLADLLVRVGVKEIADPIPVCYCLGFTRRDIHNEIDQTGGSTIAERISAEVKAGNCACEVKNPSGKCCLGSVKRETQDYLRHRQIALARPAE